MFNGAARVLLSVNNTGRKVKSRKVKRVSLNETLEFPYWGSTHFCRF